jgi:hypothetical protein
MMSRYVLASSPPGRTSRGRRWVRLLPGEQGEEGEEGEEELKLVGEEEGTQLGLGKAKAMPLLAQQEEGDGTADGEWGRGGGAAVGYIASYKSSSGFACFLRAGKDRGCRKAGRCFSSAFSRGACVWMRAK